MASLVSHGLVMEADFARKYACMCSFWVLKGAHWMLGTCGSLQQLKQVQQETSSLV